MYGYLRTSTYSSEGINNGDGSRRGGQALALLFRDEGLQRKVRRTHCQRSVPYPFYAVPSTHSEGLDVDHRPPELVVGLVEVPHTDLSEVTIMVLLGARLKVSGHDQGYRQGRPVAPSLPCQSWSCGDVDHRPVRGVIDSIVSMPLRLPIPPFDASGCPNSPVPTFVRLSVGCCLVRETPCRQSSCPS